MPSTETRGRSGYVVTTAKYVMEEYYILLTLGMRSGISALCFRCSICVLSVFLFFFSSLIPLVFLLWVLFYLFYFFNVALSRLLLGLWVKMTGDGNYKKSRNHHIVQFLALQ